MPTQAGILVLVACETFVVAYGAQEDARVRGHDGLVFSRRPRSVSPVTPEAVMPAQAGILLLVACETFVSACGAQEDARLRGHDVVKARGR